MTWGGILGATISQILGLWLAYHLGRVSMAREVREKGLPEHLQANLAHPLKEQQ